MMYAEYRSAIMASNHRDNRSSSDIDLTSYLKMLLIEEKNNRDSFLDHLDIDELLLEDQDQCDDCTRKSIFGYPTRPLYREIGHLLENWMRLRRCPVLDLPDQFMLDEKTYAAERKQTIEKVAPLLEDLMLHWTSASDSETLKKLLMILKIVGRRGLIDLLGLRKTVGSADVWPPPRKVIERTFEKKHKPESASLLSVGARALAKHCHRDHSSSWWGVCTGTEAAKNDHAAKKMKEILDEASWLNIHQLPHDVMIVEARQADGYGVRWTADGLQFRGFLEPQMQDGHDVGWRH